MQAFLHKILCISLVIRI